MLAPSGSAPTSDVSPAPWVLPKVWTAGDQRHGFFVVHRHAGERFANIPGCRKRIRLAVRPFWIHIDQTHLHGAERALKITLPAVALVGQPFAFGAPIDVLFGFPDVRASAAETERLEAQSTPAQRCPRQS